MNGIVESMPVSSQSEDAGVSIRTADSTRTDSLGFSGGGIHMHADSLPETARMSGSFTQPQPLFGGTVNTTIQHRYVTCYFLYVNCLNSQSNPALLSIMALGYQMTDRATTIST